MAVTDARRLDYIDGLRFVGASAVVVQHLFEHFTGWWARLLVDPGPGVFGVVLFFTISGFVIPFSVRRGLDVRAFAIRRITRIYPVYLTALALALAFGVLNVAPYFQTLVDARPWEWVANLLLVQDFVHARPFYSVSWTLAIEFIWYAVFVCLVKAAGPRAGAATAIGAPALMLLLTAASIALGARIPLGRPGMVYAAILGYQTYRFHEREISARSWWFQVATFEAVTLISNFVAFGYFHHPKISLAQAIGPWTIALGIFVIAVAIPAVRGRNGLARPIVAWLGATSYSIYMMHPLAIALAVHLEVPILIIPAALILTFGMALASHRWIELPGIALGRLLASRRSIEPTPATALS